MNDLEERLLQVLSESDGERLVASFLKQHPNLVHAYITKCSSHCDYILPEVGLIGMTVPDFTVISANSAGFYVTLIKLEPATDMIFTAKGVPVKRLAGAIAQIEDWREIIRCEESTVRRLLAHRAAEKGSLRCPSRKEEPENACGHRLSDIRSRVSWGIRF